MIEQQKNQQGITLVQPKETKPDGKSRRGFASMDKERHKAVSSKGGKTERVRTTPGADTRSSYEGL